MPNEKENKPMSKKRTVRVIVDPIKAAGDVAVCRISGDAPEVQGGVIFLPNGSDIDLQFELNPGTTELSWANQPFSSKVDECPERGEEAPGFRFNNKIGDSFSVDANPPAGRGRTIVHYALHFNKRGGGLATCDPVIIHD